MSLTHHDDGPLRDPWCDLGQVTGAAEAEDGRIEGVDAPQDGQRAGVGLRVGPGM